MVVPGNCFYPMPDFLFVSFLVVHLLSLSLNKILLLPIKNKNKNLNAFFNAKDFKPVSGP